MSTLSGFLKLKKLSLDISFSLFSAALFYSIIFPMLPSQITSTNWSFLVFVLSAPIAILTAMGFHGLISQIDVNNFDGKLLPMLGMILVAFGCLVLPRLIDQTPTLEVNYLWHVWAIAYGITILRMSQELEAECA